MAPYPVYLHMVVRHFDTVQGYYEFQFEGLETELHSHPAIEILKDPNGKMTFSNADTTQKNLSLVIIDANVPHRISAPQSNLQVLMTEYHEVSVKRFLSEHGICLKYGFYTSANPSLFNMYSLSEILSSGERDHQYDDRVIQVLIYLQEHEMKYDNLMEELTDLVHLSKSRLSHLFSDQVGISIKKYHLWCKLRNTIAQHLDKEEDLFASLINSGFYDQPHFSRAFKTMLGVNPTKAYNSRTVQC